jgi:Ca2+-binding EF-hand superfamily protein
MTSHIAIHNDFTGDCENYEKRCVFFLLSCLMFFFLAADPAMAGGKCAPVCREDFRKLLAERKQLMSIVDVDGNGKISDGEYEKIKKQIDINGSNMIENIEFRVFELSQNKKFMESFDRNKDGFVDKDEFSVIRSGIDSDDSGQCSALELARFFINFDDSLIGRYDGDGDGMVSVEEWNRAWKRRCGLVNHDEKSCPFGNCECIRESCIRDAEFISLFDTDGNKRISDEEWADFMKLYKKLGSRIIHEVDANDNHRLDPQEHHALIRKIGELK